MLTHEATLAVTTPLPEQQALPTGLPGSWNQLQIGEQVAFLQDRPWMLRVSTFLSAGLDTGARRMDALATHDGKNAVHQQLLASSLSTPAVHAALKLGYDEYLPTKKYR